MVDTSSNGDVEIELPAAIRFEWMPDGLRVKGYFQRADTSVIKHPGSFMVFGERIEDAMNGKAERFFVNRVEDTVQWLQKRAKGRKVA
jgi:hypothetical protein